MGFLLIFSHLPKKSLVVLNVLSYLEFSVTFSTFAACCMHTGRKRKAMNSNLVKHFSKHLMNIFSQVLMQNCISISNIDTSYVITIHICLYFYLCVSLLFRFLRCPQRNVHCTRLELNLDSQSGGFLYNGQYQNLSLFFYLFGYFLSFV